MCVFIYIFCRIFVTICIYHIVLGKLPWAFAGQAAKIEGGWLHNILQVMNVAEAWQ